MKVLFVSSARSSLEISPIIKAQANSLTKKGVQIDFYAIKEKGLKGYLDSVIPLKKVLNTKEYDFIHAHYGLSAIIATLAGAKPLVVSLMGSDVMERGWQLRLIKLYVKKRWALTIVKSSEMLKNLGSQNIFVIPNGVDINLFKPINKKEAINKAKLDPKYKYVLFLSDPMRKEKKFILAHKAFESIKNDTLKLIYLKDICYHEVPYYMNSAEVVILSSMWEGSPNVIKEAMACNCPVVTTNVGDVEWLFGNEPGYYISSFDPKDVAEKINMAIKFSKEYRKTRGRERLLALELNSEAIAKRIIEIYHEILL